MIPTTPLDYIRRMMQSKEVATELEMSVTTVSRHYRSYNPTPAIHKKYLNLVKALMSPPDITKPEERLGYEHLQSLLLVWASPRYVKRVCGRAQRYKRPKDE